MRELEQVELTCSCMVEDGKGNVLVQERVDPSWKGIAFPGGHVEKGESLAECIIREMEEETGLRIRDPRLCGVKHWVMERGRYLVFLYRTSHFSGTLRDSAEGRNFWTPLAELGHLALAPGFADNLALFLRDDLDELQYEEQDGAWHTHYWGNGDFRA